MDNIIFDCDGVLLNWELGFIEFLEHHQLFDRDKYDPFAYNVHDRHAYLGTKKVVEHYILIFNNSSSIGHLRVAGKRNCTYSNKEVLHRLLDRGWAVTVITSAGLNDHSLQLRSENLEAAYHIVFPIESYPLGALKGEIYKGPPPSIVIDDSIEQLYSWRDKYKNDIEYYFLMKTAANSNEIEKQMTELIDNNIIVINHLSDIIIDYL